MSLLQGKGIQPSYSLKKGTDKLFIQHNLFICPLPPQTRGYHYPASATDCEHKAAQSWLPQMALRLFGIFKAWSQNLGHEQVLTTLHSYGEVQQSRQGEIIQQLSTPRVESVTQSAAKIIQAVKEHINAQQGGNYELVYSKI
ncbi:hypothetical protein bplSymb_SCF02802P010 [Bathymodiolus platifrons methanotrophic gill symbiont]|uniref:hypothetical protein n=1 Tax=Bathymodiolus platifrons methanotrophic gill symbiont TaxID=113268 RepID=UPI000B6E68F6|nr:hypothetical protein [Bathymodiolus platifrons methanotrophic gill symbiont]GAW86470.1 hypothetical protein bplSymb_SCF02802P010 [Bathymodiolus platifrons methanotrophic gill symbiont]